MIPVQCATCTAAFKVKPEFAGRKARCPKCKNVLTIPAGTPAASTVALEAKPSPSADISLRLPSDSDDYTLAPAVAAPKKKKSPSVAEIDAAANQPITPKEILAAFQGHIAPVKTTLLYRFGALLVAVVMVILPLLYLALIVVVAYGVYYHAVNNTGMLEHGRGRGKIIVLAIYAAPLVVGTILVFFMIKPLFAPPGKEPRRRNLTPAGEPVLFALVEKLCQVVGAPMPKRIDVNCDINAAAGYRRGMLSLLMGSDLVLTIGIPLVENLTLKQLVGVLAHEFGHFTQGAGMRLTYLIRSINFWFMRVVYQRDAWDDWLVASAEDVDIRIGWVLYLSMLCVAISRGILWVFMMFGHVVSGFMLRQMEFDADRYETRVAGSDTFEKTARDLGMLQLGYQGALSDVGEFVQRNTLPDNLPKLIRYNLGQLPADAVRKVYKHIDTAKASIFDTHPADKDRIANSAKEKAPGIFHSELPARVLFRNYDALARNVTWDLYCEHLGSRIRPDEMKNVDDLFE